MRELYNFQRARHIDDKQDKLINILADDYQSDIQDELTKALSIQGITERKDVTIVVEIQANREYRLIGLLKNTLDALQGVLYIDDSSVKSALIYRVGHDVKHKDRMKIWILENVVVRGCHVDEVTLENNTLVYAEFDTVAESNYLLYQEDMEVSEEDKEDTKVLEESLFGEMEETVEDGEITVHIITGTDKVDIDNIALNVMAATVGRAVERIEDIRRLCVYRETDRRRRGTMKIEVEVGKDGRVVYKKGDEYIKRRPGDTAPLAARHSNTPLNNSQNMANTKERRKANG